MDWTFHLFFKRDVAMIKRFVAEPGLSSTWNEELACSTLIFSLYIVDA